MLTTNIYLVNIKVTQIQIRITQYKKSVMSYLFYCLKYDLFEQGDVSVRSIYSAVIL